MADDEIKPPPTAPSPPWWVARLFDWQRRTQRAVAELAEQQGQTAGAILGMRADIRDLRQALIDTLSTPKPPALAAGGEPYREPAAPAPVRRESSDEVSDRFEVAPGVALEVSRRRQRELVANLIVKGVAVAIAGGGWLVALIQHLLTRH